MKRHELSPFLATGLILGSFSVRFFVTLFLGAIRCPAAQVYACGGSCVVFVPGLTLMIFCENLTKVTRTLLSNNTK
jgi:hypothetical protein